MKIPRPFFPAMTAALVAAVVFDADTDAAPTDQKLHIVYLYHADCRDVAATLHQLVDRSQVEVARGGRATPLSGQPTVLPDEPTNSLVIAASPADFDVIAGVIRKLDTRREQIRVDVSVLIQDDPDGGFHVGATQSIVIGEHEAAVLPLEGLSAPVTVSALIPSDGDVRLRLTQRDCDDAASGPGGCPGAREVSVQIGDRQTVAVRFEADQQEGLLLHDSASLHALLGGAVSPGADPGLVLLVTPVVMPDPAMNPPAANLPPVH